MKRKTLKRSTARFLSVSVVALFVSASTSAWPCSGGDYSVDEMITFDRDLLKDGTNPGLFFDPSSAGFGGPCDSCAVDEMKADWATFLGSAIKPDDWMKVLLKSSLGDLDALIFAVQGKKSKIPAAFAQSSVLKVPAVDREKLVAAMFFVGFARRIEAWSARPADEWSADPPKAPVAKTDPEALQANGEKALSRAKHPFLVQRYAHALLRLRFYRENWKDAVEYFRQNESILSAPSMNLKWRAQYYVAGALRKLGDRATANLMLARIHEGAPSLAGVAVQDFAPMQEADWNATLNLAPTVREKTLLWRLVGLKLDGVAAMQKIVALDPTSDLLPLLAVRELNKAEANTTDLAAIEKLSVALAANAGTNRPWLFELVGGHAAALRGDLASARPRLDRATKARPNDPVVIKQAQASLALSLALAWKGPAAKWDDELAQSMSTLPSDSLRSSNVRSRVRAALAKVCADRGMHTEATLFGGWSQGTERWAQPTFVEALIAKLDNPTTSLERFMVASSDYKKPHLQRELALAQLLKGDFISATATFKKGATSSALGTDPFVIHIVDCHDCDHAKYGAKSKWTHANLTERLAVLEQDAKRPGEKGATSALELANALYNITWYGNARSLLEGTHNASSDTAAAEAWYKRAFEQSKNRELRAKAAFMAAKCELGRLLNANPGSELDVLPIPQTWFPVVKGFADTKYHKEILKECGHYGRWVAAMQ
jgi:hypothetical protein